MQYDWYQLPNSKHSYKTDVFSQNTLGKRFNRLQHQYMLVAVAQFGGPIAVTSDKTNILTLREDDPTLHNICLFSNQGDIIQRIKLKDPFKNIIVCLDFLKDQMLFVLFAKGEKWMIDPHTGQIKQSFIGGLVQGQQVVACKVFDIGFAVQTSTRRFLFTKSAYQPQMKQFFTVEPEMRQAQANQQVLYWRVFSPRHIVSQKVELHLVHPIAGVIQAVQDQGKRVFFNQEKGGHLAQSRLPHLRSLKYISSLSPNNKYVAYFAAQPLFKQNPADQIPQQQKKKKVEEKPIPYAFAYRLIIAPAISSQTLQTSKFRVLQLPFVKQGTHLNLSQQPLSINWCGSRALVIQFQNQQLYLCSTAGDVIKIQKDRGDKQKWSFLREEVDGTRIISRVDNKILREIPTAYMSVFQSFGQQPGALLRTAYAAFEDQQPLQDDQIRKQKDKLAKGVQQCLASARFQLNFTSITQLMKAATYGKAFLPPNTLNNNQIYETTKLLRIANQFRQKLRYITYQQLKLMGDQQLLKILLRYRQHYFAFQVYRYLKKDTNFRVKIYTDWACCRVQNYEESQQDICQSIRGKLMNQKGISFTQIAHKSIQIGRSQLAMKLLQFQPSVAKKVPLLLWIGNRQTPDNCIPFYQKSVQQALKSLDLNLLYLCIKRISSSYKLSQYALFDMFSKNLQGIYAMINYYKMFDRVQLVKYYDYLSLTQTKIMQFIRYALSSKKYQDMQKLLHTIDQYMQNLNSSLYYQWRKPIFKKILMGYQQFFKHNPNVRNTSQKNAPVNLGRQLQGFMLKQMGDAVDDFKAQYDVPAKRIILTRIKTLIQQKKFQQLMIFVQKRQKQFKIPVQFVADLLLQRGETTWAMKMLARMPSKKKDQQYLLLQRIGRYKQAIDLAFDRKDAEALEDISATLLEPTLVSYCNDKISLLRRK